MDSRKRDKPYHSRYSPFPLPKRRRPLPLDAAAGDDIDSSSNSAAAARAPTLVVVIGVPGECSVLDLKSRFEMYGPISRTRMEPDGVAYINFRSNEAAQSAVDAARDSSFPVTILSTPIMDTAAKVQTPSFSHLIVGGVSCKSESGRFRVQVMWANDPIPQWKGGVGRKNKLSSKLVRPEVPLSRHGRGNKLGSAIVKSKDDNNNNKNTNDDANNDAKFNVPAVISSSSIEGSFRGREIVAYDDIL